jgi:hypothetical protein
MLAAHLAVEAERAGDTVWVIDTDPQGTLSHWHERRQAATAAARWAPLASVIAFCASPDPQHGLFISCERLLNNCELSPLNRVYVHEKARLAVHPLAENDTSSEIHSIRAPLRACLITKAESLAL